jgi:hypothetical protein
MKSTLSALAVIVLAACSTNMSSSGPPVTVRIAQMNASSNIFYFPGPVPLQYEVSITNPTSEPLTLTRLDLQTIGSGAYFLRTAPTPMNLTIAPNSTANYTISVWGRSRGGYIRSTEPVSLRGIAYFRGPNVKSFVRMFTENVTPEP